MSNKSNAKVFIAFGVAGLAVAGGLYWYFGIHAKNQARDAAQAEVLAWEKRLAAARECLFGATPASSDSAEAIAVRELTPDPWERKTCTPLIGKLSRGVADDTGIMPVEHAWMSLDRAATKVATAFAVSKDPFGQTEADRRKGVGELPEALRELDKAHADLREAAGMSPPVSNAKVASLPKAELVALSLDGKDLTSLRSWSLPSMNSLRAFGTVKDMGVAQVTLAGGKPPAIRPTSPLSMRSPDGTWAAGGLTEEISASPVDAKGTFTARATVAKPGGQVLATAGTFDNGLIAYTTVDGDIAFARSAAATWTADKPARASNTVVAFDPAGRVLVAWSEYPPVPKNAPEEWEGLGRLRAVIARDGTPVTPVELGEATAWSGCLTQAHAWLDLDRGQFMRVDETGGTPIDQPDGSLIGCSETAALFHPGGTTKFSVCKGADACRMVDLPGSRPTRHAAIAGDKVVAITAHQRVLAVWIEASPPKFFALPEKVSPVMVLGSDKGIDILAENDESKDRQIALVRVPLF